MLAVIPVTSLVDFAVGAIALEALALTFVWYRWRRGLPPVDVVGQLLAGAILLVAVRLAVSGAPATWVLAALAASFPAHVFDLWRRARARG